MDLYMVTEGNRGLVARRLQSRKGKIVFFDGETRIVVSVTKGSYLLNFAQTILDIGIEIKFASKLGKIKWSSDLHAFVSSTSGQRIKLSKGHILTYSREGRVVVLALEISKNLAIRVASEVFNSFPVRN